MLGLHRMRLGLCLVLVVCAAPSTGVAEDPPVKHDFELGDTKGVQRRLSDYRGRWVVLEWVDFSCFSVQRLYDAPTRAIPRLQRKFANRVAWLSIDLTPSTARLALRRGSQAITRLLDPTRSATQMFGVRVTPEVRLISPLGEVVYAGGIASLTQTGAVTPYLEPVLVAAITGQPMSCPARPASGCIILFPEPGDQAGPLAPGFAAFDRRGVLHRLRDYRGKWVILEWVNYDCRLVKKHYDLSHRNMQTLQKQAKQNGVVWLSIESSARGVSPWGINERMQDLGASPAAYLIDKRGLIGRRYGARFTPEMRVINPRGEIVYTGGIDNRRSARPAEVLRAKNFIALALDAILARKPIPVRRSPPYGCRMKY